MLFSVDHLPTNLKDSSFVLNFIFFHIYFFLVVEDFLRFFFVFCLCNMFCLRLCLLFSLIKIQKKILFFSCLKYLYFYLCLYVRYILIYNYLMKMYKMPVYSCLSHSFSIYSNASHTLAHRH